MIMDNNQSQTLDVNKYRDILNIWKCFVCKKIPERALKIVICQHAFCRDCVLNLNNCPKCGEHYCRNDLKPCLLMMNYASLYDDMTKLILSAENIPEKREYQEDKAEEGKSEPVDTEAVNTEADEVDSDINQLLPTSIKHISMIKQTVPGVILSETEEHKKRKVSLESWLKPSKTIRIKKETDLQLTETISPTTLITTHSVATLPSTSSVLKCLENETKTLSTPKSRRKEKKKPQRKRLEHKIKILELEKRNLKGETRLHAACVKGNMELVNSLLKEGSNPNVKDYAGWTPLAEAVGKNNLPLVTILLEHGAWVNTPCLLNTTPLLEAVLKKNQDIIQILLKYGADMNLRSNLGHTPLSIAQDDEVIHNILLTCQPDCSVLKKIEQPFCPKNIPVICCDINEETQKHQIFKLCLELNFEVKSEFWEMATHVVTNTDEELNCECTFNVLQGILAGASIINFKWLLECHKVNSTVPIDGYEVKGTKNYPNTGAMKIARLNAYEMKPKLFDGCCFSIAGKWVDSDLEISFQDFIILIQSSGASYLLRDPDPEGIPDSEKKVMFHSNTSSSMSLVSHIIVYPPNIDCNKQPRMKYNMNHVKTLPTAWFLKCIQTFTICDP